MSISALSPSATPSLSVTTSGEDNFNDLNSLNAIRAMDDKDAALKKVAQQFESMFISMMLKNMRAANAVFEEGNIQNSNETKFYRDMYDQQLSLKIANSDVGGIGIAKSMYRQMKQNYGDRDLLGEDFNKLQSLANQSATTEALYQGNVNQMTLPASSPQKSVALADIPVSAASVSSKADLSKPRFATTESSINNEPAERAALANSPEEFVERVGPYVEKLAEKMGLDADIILAQAALETGWGRSVIAQQGDSSFNIFNIKAGSSWKGDVVSMSSLEFSNSTFKPVVSDFRRYESLEAAVADYGAFIGGSERYQPALQAQDADEYIQALHQAGYATDPNYADKVLSVYQRIGSVGKRGEG
ncbi:flagellar assembly peptidoglycan hydrolase FlgJ [Teredinibacter waterburyi]|jgi:flagellar rod assembly protein/muramidase FlgJ|uniref:flagellar assembly peptidoglycan hydrolase FlgJ n=1 Tax=Teredinibacter waterburyi TaxID=1500538 RepID=UPI00165F1B08|nr:flagellar assembly peptidoglycan hydrolase FlgJ [Teredinibacter waterburyi]